MSPLLIYSITENLKSKLTFLPFFFRQAFFSVCFMATRIVKSFGQHILGRDNKASPQNNIRMYNMTRKNIRKNNTSLHNTKVGKGSYILLPTQLSNTATPYKYSQK